MMGTDRTRSLVVPAWLSDPGLLCLTRGYSRISIAHRLPLLIPRDHLNVGPGFGGVQDLQRNAISLQLCPELLVAVQAVRARATRGVLHLGLSVAGDDARGGESLEGREGGVEEGDEGVEDGADDARAAGASERNHRLHLRVKHQRRRHRRPRPLPASGLAVVSEGRAASALASFRPVRVVAPRVSARLPRKVGHFVVEEESAPWDDDAAADVVFDRRGHAHHVAPLVRDRKVGCPRLKNLLLLLLVIS
mmetsp:Transcript_11892/g.28014  ORF Transcript_11892/g.28014 Transcript_11892/m.28014 type:complete len:249 (+) Transcript_11892:273-1019(+)